jgi:hypothetical protein
MPSLYDSHGFAALARVSVPAPTMFQKDFFCYTIIVSRGQVFPAALSKKFYKIIHKNRKDGIDISDNAIVGNREDGCLWIFIYCHNTL